MPPDEPSTRQKPPAVGRAKNEDAQMRLGYKMMGLGWQFVTEMIAGAFLGWAIGYWFGNETRGTMIGTGAGFIIATYTLIRGALKLNAALDKLERASGRPLPKPLAHPLNDKGPEQ